MTAYWTSSVSRVEGDKVLIRGYDLESLIGGQSFSASCFLLVRGRLPTPSEVRALDAVLNAVLDYALLKPGTVAARYAVSANPSMVAGLATGLVLVGVALAGALFGGLQLAPGVARPAAPFAAWAVVTILVAAAEEGILRGALFDALRSAGGTAMALLVTTVAFALIHIPLYGWGVVPLDLGVGLALGGLRLSTRTVLGPAVAHAVADLATWWL